MRKNRTCILCGKTYSYCGTCASDMNKERWHNIYHDNNCRTIFNTVADYVAGILSKEKAIETLNDCDLSQKESFKSSVLQVLNELYPVTNVTSEQQITVDKECVSEHMSSNEEHVSKQKNNNYSKSNNKPRYKK